MFQAKPVGRGLEMLGESLYRFQVCLYGSLGVISTLEFFQHHFAKSGHRDLLLVTHNLTAVDRLLLTYPDA